MRIAMTKPLFAWDSLEDSPTLKTLQQLLDVIPDGALRQSLHRARGKGRDDVPVHIVWGVLVLSITLRHPTIAACLAELRRNASLRKWIGIESEEAVPQKSTLSRLLETLGQEPHLGRLHGVFDTMIHRLGAVVPDLGPDTAGDAASSAETCRRCEAAQYGLRSPPLLWPNHQGLSHVDKGAVSLLHPFFQHPGDTTQCSQFAQRLHAPLRRTAGRRRFAERSP